MARAKWYYYKLVSASDEPVKPLTAADMNTFIDVPRRTRLQADLIVYVGEDGEPFIEKSRHHKGN